jgi:hypothetical protein
MTVNASVLAGDIADKVRMDTKIKMPYSYG